MTQAITREKENSMSKKKNVLYRVDCDKYIDIVFEAVLLDAVKKLSKKFPSVTVTLMREKKDWKSLDIWEKIDYITYVVNDTMHSLEREKTTWLS